MLSLRSAASSFGVLIALSTVSLPVWAAPQLEETAPAASNLGDAVSVSKKSLQLDSATSRNLIRRANVQLDTDSARNAAPEREPSFRWQSELLDSQRRSQTGFQFLNSNL